MRQDFDVLNTLCRDQSAKVFVRFEGVVFVEGFFELEADAGHGVGSEVATTIELFLEGVFDALNDAIAFWAHGREDQEFDV